MSEHLDSLADLRVLSFGNFVAGNTFAMQLAELGADVVKVESHQRPDPVRSRFAADHPETREPSGAETTSLFQGLSRSVRDLSIDMKHPGGVALFKQIAEVADVVFENFGAGVVDGWGIGWEELRKINPGLVMVSISGYGRTGPRAGYLAYGGNISSFTGLTDLWGQSHGSLYDYVAGAHAVAAALVALTRRDATGLGTYIDVGQVDGAANMLGSLLLDQLNSDAEAEPPGTTPPDSLLAAVVRATGDDQWVAVDVQTCEQWTGLCGLLDPEAPRRQAPGLPNDQTITAMRGRLAEWASARTAWQATQLLQRHGVPAAPVQDSEDVWRDPQLRARGSIVAVDHPDLGVIEYAAPVQRMSVTPARVRRHAPRLGQDTRYVLHRWVGLDAADIDALVASGVVGTDDPQPTPPGDRS